MDIVLGLNSMYFTRRPGMKASVVLANNVMESADAAKRLSGVWKTPLSMLAQALPFTNVFICLPPAQVPPTVITILFEKINLAMRIT